MQRVLSFQMGRGFGESSEYVSKRMCFSFLFSVGFLCLLGGFLLGRFATDQTIKMRERRILDDLAGNGLLVTKDLQLQIVDLLNASVFHENYTMDASVETLRKQGVERLRDVFADLSIFRLNVNETETSLVATICGTVEQDRYVVLSASGEGFDVAIKLAQILDNIYRTKGWEPKRTLIFCVFYGSTDYCGKRFLNRVKPDIAAYIAVHGNAARGTEDIVVSGSGMVQATILDALNEIKFYHRLDNSFKAKQSPNSLPRLNLDVPHAVLSFVNPSSNLTTEEVELNQKILAQIVALSMYRFSEEIFFQWEPNYFNEIMSKALGLIKSEELKETKDHLNQTVAMFNHSLVEFNQKLKDTYVLNAVDVRMMNDRLLDLDRALLCSDTKLRSITDFVQFMRFPHEPAHTVKMDLNNIIDCYKAATEIILEQAYCRRIFKDLVEF
ncbi:uncharacterized protein LOC100679547 [Nasonia vitripennis]|uniref:Uncharacterized protein n=1 Tax=Nasonia vitripennis TaxID=7425 RepID=A0A7M7TDB5_NASVI|nr:uncharacterized protein LOC100679547 [Nasonia vitripennis]XP_032455191.1 uncharacterized protein LOC100679547 [Nasonia vitripennis]XP_032455192.1 uncharacterized protein LOC100679547 [Nasonia vitripennis]